MPFNATPDGKRYRTFSGYLKQQFGCRVRKISLDAGFTCPNRDGTRGDGGCLYCNNESFSYHTSRKGLSVRQQLETGMAFMRGRYHAQKFIAYFQTHSATYAPLDRLRATYDIVRDFPDLVGLFIGTRPDCVDESVLDLVASYRRDYLTWIEYGLQSSNENTLRRINRGHTVREFSDAVALAQKRKLPICAHVILGLPGEGRREMMDTAEFLAGSGISGIKLHALHVVTETPLAQQYRQGDLALLEFEEYVGLVCDFLERIPGSVVVQRIGVDVPERLLIAPSWCTRKHELIRAVDAELERRDSWQGKLFGNAV